MGGAERDIPHRWCSSELEIQETSVKGRDYSKYSSKGGLQILYPLNPSEGIGAGTWYTENSTMNNFRTLIPLKLKATGECGKEKEQRLGQLDTESDKEMGRL